MRRTALVLTLVFACCATARSETIDVHKIVQPQDVKWGGPPPGLPAGAEGATLYGDPAQAGLFVVRVKLPKGYAIAAHMHQRAELLTVISGNLSLGLGKKADRGSVETLSAGTFSSMPQGVVHYVFVDEDSVIQIAATGPWSIDYVDPKEDPRLNRTGQRTAPSE